MNSVASIETVLLLGGSSEIAVATALELCRRGTHTFILAGRHRPALEAAADRVAQAGARAVSVVDFDATEVDGHDAFLDRVFDQYGDIDLVLLAFGILGDQHLAENSRDEALAVIRTNFEGSVSVAIPAARRLRGQGHGHLVLISSVAAERARADNFVYGASKAGADAFFQGLASSMRDSGIHVMVVRPGRVTTRMSEGLAPVPFTTTPECVARDIARGLERGAGIVWSPPVLRIVMSGLRHLPAPIFRRVESGDSRR